MLNPVELTALFSRCHENSEIVTRVYALTIAIVVIANIITSLRESGILIEDS